MKFRGFLNNDED